MGFVVGLLEGVTAEAIVLTNEPGGYVSTAIIMLVGALLGVCIAGALFAAEAVDDF